MGYVAHAFKKITSSGNVTIGTSDGIPADFQASGYMVVWADRSTITTTSASHYSFSRGVTDLTSSACHGAAAENAGVDKHTILRNDKLGHLIDPTDGSEVGTMTHVSVASGEITINVTDATSDRYVFVTAFGEGCTCKVDTFAHAKVDSNVITWNDADCLGTGKPPDMVFVGGGDPSNGFGTVSTNDIYHSYGWSLITQGNPPSVADQRCGSMWCNDTTTADNYAYWGDGEVLSSGSTTSSLKDVSAVSNSDPVITIDTVSGTGAFAAWVFFVDLDGLTAESGKLTLPTATGDHTHTEITLDPYYMELWGSGVRDDRINTQTSVNRDASFMNQTWMREESGYQHTLMLHNQDNVSTHNANTVIAAQTLYMPIHTDLTETAGNSYIADPPTPLTDLFSSGNLKMNYSHIRDVPPQHGAVWYWAVEEGTITSAGPDQWGLQAPTHFPLPSSVVGY